MFKYSLSWYIFTFALLETIVKTHLTAHDSSHGFISNNQRYFDDDIAVIHEEISSGLRSARINDGSLKLQLKFEPAVLDFKHRPLGVPHLEKVTLFNIDANKSIDMTSISGSTVHFHSSFFEDKKIPPLGNTSFNVVFLGREEGFVESSLFIHTTEGHFKYNVKGASIFSPYRLRPIVGIKLPVNATFAPLIHLYNPHSEPIQITEIYSSGGDFHLELPTGELEGPKNMWEILPLQTRPIIRVRFHAKTEQNHTAYVRIKVNSSEEILVVPLEVEVTPNGGSGIFVPQGSIDFGIGGNLDPTKKMPICLYNSLKKPIRIHSITTDSEAIKIDYENIKLLPSVKEKESCVKIGTLSLDWDIAFKTKDYAGKIIVKYKNGKCKTEIPYYLTVLEGGLSYDPLITRYFINDKTEDLLMRTINMKNNFLDSIRIINITLFEESQKFFNVVNFQSVVIKPQQDLSVFTLKLKTGNLSELKINSNILVKTNISDLIIPLLSYSGKLHVQFPYESKDYSLDLGLISTSSQKEIFILIANINPVQIDLKQLQTSIPMSSIEKIGCGVSTNYKLALLNLSFKNLTKCNVLKTNSYAILKLIVKTPDSQTQQWGTIQIETQYENLSIPVHFKVSLGKLEIGPDRLVFDQCFPGKICSHPLRVHSTFYEPMIIENILTLPPDKRVFSKHFGHISARATKVVGHLFLDPAVDCGSECYAGMQHDTTAQWLKMLSLPNSVPDFDLNLVNTFYNRYLNTTGNGSKNWQNLTLRLDTTEVKGHLFKSRVKMSWPSLLLENHNENKSIHFTFPLTQIGNITYKNITIRNPSSYNLIIQLVFDQNYPDVHLLYEGLPMNFLPQNLQDSSKIKHGFFFDLNYKDYLKEFNELLNYDVHKETLPLLLKPNENFTFTIGFRGEDTILNSALIFIRNNLTILEVIKLKGQAAHPVFKFGNRKPGSLQPLQFELTEKHLKECKNQMPNLTVKRSFTARNLGDVTIYINEFKINNLLCEGYGFRILNCSPFVLLPNSTKKIDIAFTPDLTLTKITRTLILKTSLNTPVNYTLHTTIPSFYLNLCSNFIIRPNWEYYLSLLSICLMFTLLVVIILLAIVDSERIKKQTLACLLHTNNVQTQPILDLRLVGQQTRDEIHSNKIDEQKIERKLDEKIKEPEKYTVLIPTIGKSKKKLAKKNSGELTNDNITETKRSDLKTFKNPLKIKEDDFKNPLKIKEDDKKIQKDTKKLIQNKTKAKNVPVLVYEEETLTTESSSSSNNDEIDDQRKSCVKKTQVNKMDINEELNERNHTKIERKRSGQKPIQKSVINDKPIEKSETKKCFRSNFKKDKQIKKVLDKSVNNHRNCDFNRNSPNINRVSPPINQQTVWGENRATFSDIVARTEQQQNIIRPKQLENYKQTTELGPIGSERTEFWQENQEFDQNNSFFSNAQDLQPLDNNNGFLDDFTDNWQNGLIDLPNDNTDLWNQTNLINTNSYWSSMNYTLPAIQQQSQSQQINSQTGFLWGSSSVWEPWAPPRTPTRTPPGFDVAHQRRNEEQTQQREVYNPFGTNCLWTQQQQQQQQNPWNFQ